ncbi:aconitase family protein, partial [Halomonas sp. KM-1]|uniref:aconitase family protein n=1 Tax=Halomonas sp. KM-1 TaxID=590061 RepID=UPI001930C5D4
MNKLPATFVEKVITQHADRESVEEGDLVTVKVDRIYLQDGNTPTISKLFKKYGFKTVFDAQRIGVFFDHSVLAPDKHIADRLKEAEEFAESLGLKIFRAGSGISHVVALEEGWYEPKTIVIGSDSHTCTGGAAQCLSLGMGASDCTAAMVTGETWLKVPSTIWINVEGSPVNITKSRDLVMYILSLYGQTPFLYKSIEWNGTWIENLSLDSCASLANLGVEMGAKCSILPPGNGRPAQMLPLTLPDAGDPRVINLNI